ncbi:hypothetical protein EJ04DRAFT_505710 [Polyplosphaeria fusca]|uniref:Uncharacterized protein n=1 Tax=Polyplosphaeria fusca TaxID=682080 RepID=A0A9P4QMF4_9PLEO|nr:hypothetical protein EJ04DRAFT_505710 [Polyplosphaeria fusca]
MARIRPQAREATGLQTPWMTSPSLAQPTTTLALSTTFTPAASCTDNKLTMLPSPGFFLFVNEPVPFPNTTVTNCYPSEFLKSYTAISSSTYGSSIVPVMSPLVCPSNFCTRWVGDDNYIVCCPSGYGFRPPATPSIRDRPGYGGSCSSLFSLSQTTTVLKYNVDGLTNVEPWTASTPGMNAYAHPIDGFAASSPAVGCGNPSSSSLTLSTSSVPSTVTAAVGGDTPSSSKGVSSGTIAGAAVGSILGLAAIVCLVFFLLRRNRYNHREDGPGGDHNTAPTEIYTPEYPGQNNEKSGDTSRHLEIYEMNAHTVHEMPTEENDKKG